MKETVQIKIARLLEANPDGMTAPEILTALNITKQSLYSAVFAFNEKKTGQKIKSIDFKYKIIGTRKSNLLAVVDQHEPPAFPAGFSLPQGFSKKIKNLSSEDVANLADMLKKSLFYQKSATALIEASEAAAIFRESLTMQGGL
ncbi:MAG: hypothetical protein PHF86_06465 [Candidatus Nanoarchaeia archaeon]|jgi:hypothetical protein|nr:hypothetical protein [Candidatus Nanoarchaeia archaeon]